MKDYKAQKRAQIEKVINEFSNIVNSTTFGEEENQILFEAFSRQHRTLQQSIFEVLLQLIAKISSDEYYTDGRNENSKLVAIKIVKNLAEAYKQEYLSVPGRSGEEYFEKKAEEYKQLFLENPEKYLGLPLI